MSTLGIRKIAIDLTSKAQTCLISLFLRLFFFLQSLTRKVARVMDLKRKSKEENTPQQLLQPGIFFIFFFELLRTYLTAPLDHVALIVYCRMSHKRIQSANQMKKYHCHTVGACKCVIWFTRDQSSILYNMPKNATVPFHFTHGEADCSFGMC